jgi:ATP-dependent exoDNAse (exonuclease V) beta subunit
MTAPAAHRLLRASAGTGKTYQLVQAYVRLVQEDKLRPAQIVAITFTRKAAAELRLRIRAELHARGAPPSVLSELSRAPLGNFHGLALQIMASFGLDAGLYGPIQVLAEAHADRALFAQGCADAWFAGDTQVAAAVETVAPYLRVGDTFSAALWEAIALAREDGVAITADHLAHADAPALLAPAQAHLEAMRSRLLAGDPALTAVAVARLARFAAHPVPTLASVLHMPATASVDERAKAVADWHAGWQAMFACLDRRSKLKLIYSAEDADYVRKELSAIQAGVLTAALRPAVGTLLVAGWRAYGRLKAERGLVDFVDIIERFNALMHARPDLHAALRGRYAAVLVDEAQDTNRLQRAMVDLLCGFAGPAAAEIPPAQAFVVGDWKQSIYTFRGADPQSFNDFANDLQGYGGQESHLAISRRFAAGFGARHQQPGRRHVRRTL